MNRPNPDYDFVNNILNEIVDPTHSKPFLNEISPTLPDLPKPNPIIIPDPIKPDPVNPKPSPTPTPSIGLTEEEKEAIKNYASVKAKVTILEGRNKNLIKVLKLLRDNEV